MRFMVELNPNDATDALTISWLEDRSKEYGGDIELTLHCAALWPAVCRDRREEAIKIGEQIEADELSGKAAALREQDPEWVKAQAKRVEQAIRDADNAG